MLEDPDGEVMIGEIQVNEEVRQPWSDISKTDLYDWQQRECAGDSARVPITMTIS